MRVPSSRRTWHVPWLLLVLAVAGALALTAAPSAATQPGTNGTMLVLGARNGQFGAHLVDLDTASLTRLPVEVENPQGVDWSPDGTQIVMALTEEPEGLTTNLWIMGADGSDARVLVAADEGVHLIAPTWSPDGERIAFAIVDRPSAKLAIVHADGTGEIELGEVAAAGDPIALRWSPVGDRLLVELFGDLTVALATFDLATLELASLGLGSEADWSPNGQSIVFVSRDEDGVPGVTTIMAADGREATPLDPLAELGILGFAPVWAPDGSRIAFVRLGTAGSNDLIGLVTPGGEVSFLDLGFEHIADLAWQPIPTPSGFVDVAGDHTFSNDIGWLRTNGFTFGCDPPNAIHFCPERPITRGEAVAMVVRALALPAPAESDAFSDDDDSIFEGDLDAAAAFGVVRGCNPPANDHACPNARLVRGEAAAIFARALRLGPPVVDHFDDDDDSVFAYDINRIADAGITLGCDPPANLHFCPNDELTRGQHAAFMHRAFG